MEFLLKQLTDLEGVFARGKPVDPHVDLVDLTGKVCIVTGGSSGLGLHLVRILAQRGAKVYMAARSESKALGAIASLRLNDTHSVEWLHFDSTSISTIREAANTFMSKETRLDILVNNAGIMNGPFEMGENGILDVTMTNHVGPFAFTNLLLPIIKQTAQEPSPDVRIVNVSSRAHNRPGPVHNFIGRESLNIRFPNNFQGNMQQYGYTKLMNILHIKELQRRLDSDGVDVVCISLHPGEVHSPGMARMVGENIPLGWLCIKLGLWLGVVIPEESGALTPAFAAASRKVKDNKASFKGVYLLPYGVISSSRVKAVTDHELATQLWETTESVVSELNRQT